MRRTQPPARSRTEPSDDPIRKLLRTFDYDISPEDFFLSQVAFLVNEDRISLEDPEFREIIAAGFHFHLEDRPAVRSRLAQELRSLQTQNPGLQKTIGRLDHALLSGEPLGDDARLVESYAQALLRALERLPGEDESLETEAASAIGRWKRGEILTPELESTLATLGRSAYGPMVEELAEAEENSAVSDVMVRVLAQIGSPAAYRILAHLIEQPSLNEALENTVAGILKDHWPDVRAYVLFRLRKHDHEDLPLRWFELLHECGEREGEDLALDEIVTHAAESQHREDLNHLASLLLAKGSPSVPEKILSLMNESHVSGQARKVLDNLIQNWGTSRP